MINRLFTRNSTSQSGIKSFFNHPTYGDYSGLPRISHVVSKHHVIDIIENDMFGRMLFLNKIIQISEKHDGAYFDSITRPLCRPFAPKNLERVAIVGGGSGGTVYRLLQEKSKKIYVVDIDEAVINESKKHLRCIHRGAFDNETVEVVISDANVFLEKVGNLDAVIYDLEDYSSIITETDREEYLDALFFNVKNSLKYGGIVSLHCCSEYNENAFRIIKAILTKHFKNVTFRKAFIPSFGMKWIFASAEKESPGQMFFFSIGGICRKLEFLKSQIFFSHVRRRVPRPLESLYKLSAVLKEGVPLYRYLLSYIKGHL